MPADLETPAETKTSATAETPTEAETPAATEAPTPALSPSAVLDIHGESPAAPAPATKTAPSPETDGLLAPPEHPIRLPAFEGPLDLLLYLIRKNEIDIYDIPIETVTRQYLEILRTTERDNLEVAGEFFVMAATLMYIKSRMLLPPDKVTDDGGDANAESQTEHELDPRWELVAQLIQYKKIKECATHLDNLIAERQAYLPRLVSAMPDEFATERPLAPGDRIELWNTFNRILERLADRLTPGEIKNESTTISSRMEDILERLARENRFAFTSLLPEKPTVAVLVSTFLACLELARLGKLYLAQSDLFDEIYCDTEPPPIPPEAAIEPLLPGRRRFLAAHRKAEAAADAENLATDDEETSETNYEETADDEVETYEAPNLDDEVETETADEAHTAENHEPETSTTADEAPALAPSPSPSAVLAIYGESPAADSSPALAIYAEPPAEPPAPTQPSPSLPATENPPAPDA